jgi:O-antigen/teichoic acid export membrane protein
MVDETAPGAATRGSRRDRVLTRTIVSSAGVQGVQLAASIVTLPIAARSLSSPEFGVLVVLTGVASLLSFADLGIGSALTTRVAAARGRSDIGDLQQSMGTAAVMTACCGLALLAVGSTAAWLVPWRDVLGAPEVSQSSMRYSVLAAAVGAAVFVVGSLGQRILFGAQLGHVANRWLASGLAASALGTILCAFLHLPLFAYVLSGLAVPGVVSLGCTLIWLRRVGEASIGVLVKSSRWSAATPMAGPSFWFFLIGLSGSVAYQTDAFVVANVLGASAAGVYSVAARLFGIIPQVAYPAMLQFWPTAVDALVHGDHDWVASRFRRAVGLALGVGVVSCGFLSVTAAPVIGAWLGEDLVPPAPLVVALAIWTVYTITAYAPFAIMNAVGRVRLHAMVAVGVAVLNLPLTILLTSRIGLEGAVFGSLISNVVVSVGPSLWIARKVMTRRLRIVAATTPD